MDPSYDHENQLAAKKKIIADAWTIKQHALEYTGLAKKAAGRIQQILVLSDASRWPVLK
jgi:hypothetical protein